MDGMRVPLLFAVMLVGLAGCQVAPPEQPEVQSPVQRGEYLVAIMGCDDCHTPKRMGEKGPEPDMARMLSGHPEEFQLLTLPPLPEPWAAAATPSLTAWAGPWGISYASNLTPEEETGLGSWDEETFIQAMRTGLHLGQGRPILPPMPRAIAEATDEDLKAIFAYLASIPPIRNEIPEPLIIEPEARSD
jgi:hypothetical protein